MWQQVVRTKNHLNGDDVIYTLKQGGGAWLWDSDEAKHPKNENSPLGNRYSVEEQLYRFNNKNQTVGYVKNRSFNLNTKGTGDCKIDLS